MRRAERGLLVIGVGLLGVYFGARAFSVFSARLAVQKFEKTLAAGRHEPGGAQARAAPAEQIDFSAWAEERIRAYQESLAGSFDPAIAVLRIPRVKLAVPVFEGTDDLTLNRGVGRIIGTARPGQAGNLGIAGHRDGFFRSLKDIGMGDAIELEVQGKRLHFVIEQVQVVTPDDVSVLHPTTEPSLTLVTCYPFYFNGHAPKRFIVHATIKDSAVLSTQGKYETQAESNQP